MIDFIAFAAASAAFLAAAAALAVKSMHIFQLNSYKPQMQLKWVRDNITGHFARTVPALAAAPAVRELGSLGVFIATALFSRGFDAEPAEKKRRSPLYIRQG
jgi:hypothetical protein